MGDVVTPVQLLDRPIFEIAEAARVLGLGSTLYWWLHGRQTHDRSYLPALRSRVNRDREVTWGEFIEAAMLKDLRRNHKVKLDSVRTIRFSIGREFPDARYPLAQHDVYLNGRILSHAMSSAGLRGEEATYEPDTKTVRWGPSVTAFLKRLTWHDSVPVRYQPSFEHPDVAVEPTRQFGATQVDGMRTAAIYDLVEAGEPIEWIAEAWSKPVALVQQAYDYERGLRRGRAAA